jgi:hypothetical protein
MRNHAGTGNPCPGMGQTTLGNSFRRLLHQRQSYGSRPTAGGCDQLNTESHGAQEPIDASLPFSYPRPRKPVRELFVRSDGEPGRPAELFARVRTRSHPALTFRRETPTMAISSEPPQVPKRARSGSYEDVLISPRERAINALALPADRTYTGPVARTLASALLQGKPALRAAAQTAGFHALDR